MKKKKLCKTGECFNAPAPNRNVCYKCRSRDIIKRKPIDMCFYWLKRSAKKRNLPFTITLIWFRNWIVLTNYMERRGTGAECLTIDRVDNLRGYEADNLQILTKAENSSKYHNEDEYRQSMIECFGEQYDKEVPF